MVKVRIAAVGLAGAIIGGSMLATAPASAAPANCGSGAGCAFENTGFGGGWLGFQNSISDFAAHEWSGSRNNADNSTSSFYNNGNVQKIAWYKDRNKGRAPYYLGLKAYDSNLHDGVGTPAGWQDVIGSSYFQK